MNEKIMKNFLKASFNIAACIIGADMAAISGFTMLMNMLPHGGRSESAPLFLLVGVGLFGVGFYNLLKKGKDQSSPSQTPNASPNP